MNVFTQDDKNLISKIKAAWNKNNIVSVDFDAKIILNVLNEKFLKKEFLNINNIVIAYLISQSSEAFDIDKCDKLISVYYPSAEDKTRELYRVDIASYYKRLTS